MLTQERLKEVIEYNPLTGECIWLTDWRAGIRAGYLRELRYHMIVVDCQCYPRARLAFLYMTGRWPNGIVDHINGTSWDDRWENLREATITQNIANTKSFGQFPKGVSRSKSKFKAEIRINGIKRYLGTFGTPEEAGLAYKNKAIELYGVYAWEKNHG